MMAMGITTCSTALFDAFLSDDRKKTLFHSHSFTANPMACAAALASMDLMERAVTWENIARIEASHVAWKLQQKSDIIQNIRIQGTILAFELAVGESTGYLHSIRDHAYEYFIKKGILMRPLGNTLYILAPYCISNSELASIYAEIEELAESLIN
jgi:adenosylmethionine-8-amino-7-oxononanoate aminotransferase